MQMLNDVVARGALGVVLALGLAETVYAQAADQTAVGKMGNVEVKAADMKRLIDAQTPEVRKQLAAGLADLDRLVRTELVRQSILAEARDRGLDKKPEVTLAMERAREQALLQAYVNTLARPPANYPSEEEIKAFYDANQSAFAVPAQYRLSQVFVSSPEAADKTLAASASKKATELAARLQKPNADFGRIAKESSEHKDSAAKDGDLGWLPDSQIIPEIRSALARMTKGEVSAAVKTATGWHIIKLVDKKPAGTKELAEARNQIAANMRMRRAQEIERAYIESILAKSPATVNQIELSKLQATIK